MKQTVHVECVCLLSKRSEARNHIDVKVDMNEIDVTSAEKKQLANRLRNNNLAKNESSIERRCTPEKEKAIMDAFKYFAMI